MIATTEKTIVCRMFHTFTIIKCREKTAIKIRLDDDCKNGHETFSLTADIYEKDGRGAWRDAGGGCCHDHILELRPDLKPFADLHLADQDGVPMHAFANAFYWFAGFGPGVSAEFSGGPGSGAKLPDECRRIFSEHIRASEAEVSAIVASQPRSEQELQAVLEDMGFPERWKAQAEAAIRQLETWTGQTFASEATRAGFKPLAAEVRKLIAERRASGYYSPEKTAERDAANAAAAKAERLAAIRADFDRAMEKMHREMKVKLYVAERFPCLNCIYYTHTNTLSFNWSSLERLVTREEFNAFVAAAEMSDLPQDIRFEFKDKPKY